MNNLQSPLNQKRINPQNLPSANKIPDTSSYQPPAWKSSIKSKGYDFQKNYEVLKKSKAFFATPLARLVAFLIDAVVVAALTKLTEMSITFLTNSLAGSHAQISDTASSLAQIPSYIVGPAYLIFTTSSRGQTLGKIAASIKVIKLNSQRPPGFFSAFLREIIGKAISTAFFGLGLVWLLWDKERQTWHDKLAGTVVVNFREEVAPENLIREPNT